MAPPEHRRPIAEMDGGGQTISPSVVCIPSCVFRRPYSVVWELVGLGRFELPTSRLSSARSNQLSYKPAPGFRSQSSPGSVVTGSVVTGAVVTGSVVTGSVVTGSVVTGSVVTGSVVTGSVVTGSV